MESIRRGTRLKQINQNIGQQNKTIEQKDETLTSMLAKQIQQRWKALNKNRNLDDSSSWGSDSSFNSET